MQFDSLTFIVFFALTLLGYSLLRAWPVRKNFLLLASYTFYAAWNPLFIPLLLGTSTFDWYTARCMSAEQNPRRRKIWIWFIVSVNLGVLGYFKYSYFVLQNTAELLSWFGVEYAANRWDVILPIGISFYTFHSLSYCLDIYRRKFAVVDNLRDYLLYVSFFPQLVAGPIVRWTEMREQIEQPRHMNLNDTTIGLSMMVVGLFEKIVLADTVFAPVADEFFSHALEQDGAAAWRGALAFSGQIFSDFAGYTTCALGAALVLGFRLPINFLNPYAAVGFADFWRRWHISLSTWLRDYLYIGLGGNRRGQLFTFRNLMLTMLIGGLWHGAAWTFVIWGGLHGFYLVLERLARQHLLPENFGTWRPGQLFYGLITFAMVTLAWVWFRAPDFATAWHASGQMLSGSALSGWQVGLTGAEQVALAAITGLVLGQWLVKNHTLPDLLGRLHPLLLGTLIGLLGSLIALSPGDSNAFIYFQF